MGHADYFPAPKLPIVGAVYEPLIDFLGPYYLFPPHCHKTSWSTHGRKTKGRASTIIAYIE